MSVIPVLAGGGTVFLDRRAHKTIYDGTKIATSNGARVKRYEHDDLDHLEQLLKDAPGGPRLICMDGVNSMTGNAPDLPAFAELAREAGALTVGIVTRPFLFEGRKRMRQAETGIAEMRKHVDTMIVVPNERLLAVVGKGIPFQDALKKADEVLLHATQGISSLISVTGLVNVDFADVRTVMQSGGSALMGTGIGRGENRAMEAAQQAISSPLLDNVSISGATGGAIEAIESKMPVCSSSPVASNPGWRRTRCWVVRVPDRSA